MLEQIYTFLFILVFAYPLGVATMKFAEFMDHAMNYTQIFDFVRYYGIRKFAENKKKFDEDFKEAASVDIDDRISAVDRVYRVHAVKKSRGWLCPKCIFGQLLVIVTISLVVILKLEWYFWIPLFYFSYLGYDKE